jgi:undecaprenyl diphosphate synthase
MTTETKTSSDPLAALSPLPQHVAIILDGHSRWAKRHKLPRLRGHEAGIRNLRRVVKTFAAYHIKYLTLYAFSTENWSRPQAEVNGLFRLLNQVIHREALALHKQGVKICHIGRLDRLPRQTQEHIRWALDLTQDNTGMVLTVALDYGGRCEIVDAIRRMVRDGIPSEAINEVTLSKYLYTSSLPDPDLVIRTGGEMRISNFLIWQSAYAEFYSTPTPWPDFDEQEVQRALLAYSQRERRFGGRVSSD